jgi:hypothetical protein
MKFQLETFFFDTPIYTDINISEEDEILDEQLDELRKKK